MGKTLLFLVVLVLVCAAGFYYYRNYYRHDATFGTGAVKCEGCMTPEQKTAFERENAGEGPDGQSEHKWDFSRGQDGQRREWSSADETAYPQDQPGIPTNEPAGWASREQSGSDRDARDRDGSVRSWFGRDRSDRDGSDRGRSDRERTPSYPPPARDTVPPYPPNGVGFAGKGAYQWYREGNITWRVDTVSGRSCIAYATMEEWRKRIVMDHACGSNS